MKVKHLLKQLLENVDTFGNDYLDWDVYLEQACKKDKEYKRKSKWRIIKDDDDWEYFECAVPDKVLSTHFRKKKIVTININY